VSVAPLREYIEEWLKKVIIKIIEGPMEAVNIGHIMTTNKDTKGTSTSK
jgi:hypothetical protein